MSLGKKVSISAPLKQVLPISTKSQTARLTIGAFIPMSNQIDVLTLNPIWSGALDTARERDVNLISFMNHRRQFLSQAQATFDLVSTEILDGLIMASGELGLYIPLEELINFCQCIPALPKVSLSVPLDGIPSVVVDDTKGLRDALEHLIKDHGYRRLAFISGPKNHPEVQKRYQTYLDALTEYNLPVDETLIVVSGYNRKDGEEAVRQLLDERQTQFDVIVTLDDKVALGAIDALQARGLQVPGDVAVVGFDDIVEETRPFHPPLTTVRYPFYHLGRRSVEIVLDLLTGQPVPAQVAVPTQLIIRQSCGCLESQVGWTPTRVVTADRQSFQVAFARRRVDIRAEIKEALSKSGDNSQLEQIDLL